MRAPRWNLSADSLDKTSRVATLLPYSKGERRCCMHAEFTSLSKIEAAAVKAVMLNLGFVFERQAQVFVAHFSDDSWLSIKEQDCLTFASAACAVGRFYFRNVTFAREAYSISQALIAAAVSFEDEQALLANARKI